MKKKNVWDDPKFRKKQMKNKWRNFQFGKNLKKTRNEISTS